MTPDIETLIERLEAMKAQAMYCGALTDDEGRLITQAQTALRAVQWRPISEAPKDRPIDAVVNGEVRIVRWGKTSHSPWVGFCLADQGVEDFDICAPTVWRERPTAPLPAARASKEG